MKLRSVLTLVALGACLGPAAAASLGFVPADLQTTQTPAQVFVRDEHAPAESDDRGPVHVAGFRGARSDDDPEIEVYNADGATLLFTLDKWRAAIGTIDVAPGTGPGGDRVTLTLHKLIAFGHYSVFTRVVGADGVRFAPLDGSGITNDFDARQDGSANIIVTAPQHLSPGTAVVVIYHSDGADHGNSPGDFTRTAHQQLIAKLP